MKEIIIHNQKEFDALPDSFKELTRIILQDTTERISVSKAWGNSTIEAWENSTIVAWGNSTIVARGNSSVVARENSSVEAWENSTIEAWGNSTIVARGNSSVVARENSTIEAWGNSTIEAWGNSGCHALSDFCTVTLFAFSVCWKMSKAKINKKSKTATIITPKEIKDWFKKEGIDVKSEKAIVFKRVSKDFKTQEGTKNQTIWNIGAVVEHIKWEPRQNECGEGKYHACSRPYFCDEFRSEKGDKYIAVELAIKDTYAWPNAEFPHKIAFRKGKILYEVNRLGKKI